MDNIKPVYCGCGGEAEVTFESSSLYYTVHCKKCEIETYLYDSEAEAVESWNKAMGAKDINVPNKDIVIIEPFTIDMNHIGYCKCGYLVNAEWEYCPHCGARLEWK